MLMALHRLSIIALLDVHDVGCVANLPEAGATPEPAGRPCGPALVHQDSFYAILALAGPQFLKKTFQRIGQRHDSFTTLAAALFQRRLDDCDLFQMIPCERHQIG